MQQFGTPVPAFREMEQLRRLIQEIGGIGAVDKMRMLQQVFQKCDVGLHAADTEFLQAAQHLGHRDGMVQAPGGGLNQQRIIVRGDDGTREGIARVQTDAHAAAAAVGDELARIRHEIVQRVFRSDTALDGFAPDADLVLLRNAHFRAVDAVALRNADLALDDIDPRNGFRNGMFHLDTGVYFNKIELVISRNQKFHGAGADVIHIFHQLHRRVADPLPQFRLHEGGRSHLHHLLVTALHGAVALVQVHDLALFVAQDLHFNMFRVFQIFFQINLIVAKSFQRFGLGQGIGGIHFLRGIDRAHAATAAAVDRFNQQRIPVLFAESPHVFHGRNGTVAAGDHGNVRQLCLGAGVDLVPEHDQVFHPGTDKEESFFGAALGQLGVFRQEPVAGMDGVHVMFMGDPHDILNIQIGFHRALAPAYQIGFIGFIAMQG